jgi:exopolyphosphatase/guanosine-5'-triphosphate,3'-diphosphate pyrophosphatase
MEMDPIQSVNKNRTAIVDCGTNTFNLLVVEHNHEAWAPIFSNKIPVKIGEGGFEEQRIMESKMVRALDVLNHYKEVCHLLDVSQVKVVATSAIRDAENSDRLVKLIQKYLGWSMEIISGDEEARLIYQGIRNTSVLQGKVSLIMDIGGGSTEFIIGDDTNLYWKKSYPLGVSRLFEKIQPEERLSAANIQQLKGILENELQDLKEALLAYPCEQLVGASGSFDTLLDIFTSANRESIQPSNEHYQEIPISAFPAIHLWLMGSTMKERLSHRAIPALRAEYLPLSSWMVKYVLELSKVKKMYRSAYALKEGLLKTTLAIH